jgi:sugar phosphate isomerase/epimerase
MYNPLHRRTFLANLATLPFLAMGVNANGGVESKQKNAGKKQILKTSLNAFSFNDHLLKGNMTLEDLLQFCADTGFSGVDITGYYFKGYPTVPPDEYIFSVKRKAFELGLEISGTGVRNDFTVADQTKRAAEVDLVKKWIEVAAKAGAPVLRIFSGTQKNEGIAKQKVREWMMKDIQTCVDYGKQHGVIIGLQNHNDFIQTADEIVSIIKEINSPWLGIILDTGSYRVYDPYEEISKSVQYAVNWQIKEKIFVNGNEVDTDLPKLMGIIRASAYNGYLPIETLGAGDPKIKVPVLLEKLKQAMA